MNWLQLKHLARFRIVFLLFTFSAGPLLPQNAETRLLRHINGTYHPGWDKTMNILSTSVYFLEPLPPVGITLHGIAAKDQDLMWNGAKSAISLCTALALSTGLKYTINRPRPFNKYAGYIDGRDDPFTPSFPSGHTTAAFATATSLSLTYRKWYVAVPAFTYAGLTAYARMRLGVHYPTDVLAGIVLGTGASLLTWHLHNKLTK